MVSGEKSFLIFQKKHFFTSNMFSQIEIILFSLWSKKKILKKM